MLWSLPLLASGLLALLRYGFGSLFVVGESVAAVLLRSAGADIAVTRCSNWMRTHPWWTAAEAATSASWSWPQPPSSLVQRRPAVAAGLAAISGAEAWWFGQPFGTAVLASAAIAAIVTLRG